VITIERLHITSALDDALLTRLRIERLLAAVQMRTISPSALVVIRHLPDPLPGAIDLHRDWLRPPLVWEQAFMAQLERCMTSAVRPITGYVPPDAPAVWFADEAEYLACLSMDWVRGELTGRWWWRAALRADSHAAIEQAWIERPHAVPVALYYLAQHGMHDAVLARLSTVALEAINLHVTQAYGLPDASTSLIPLEPTHAAPRWVQTAIPEARKSPLPPAARRLLIIGLLLARRPSEARRLLHTWLQPSPAEVDAGVVDGPPAHPEAYHLPAECVPDTTVAPAEHPAANVVDGAPPIQPGDAPITYSDAIPALALAALHTHYGGVFFLLNVALALHLYGDFTEPSYTGLVLSPWDWLALVSERMCGPAWKVDGLLTLLAELAGRRSATPPGANVAPPAEWRVPPAWLAAFPESGDCRVVIVDERLQLIHPAGFTLADVPLSADTEQQASDLAHGYTLTRSHVAPAERASPFAAVPITWGAWMDSFIPYLRARLWRALELPPESYLRLSAHVFTSATHVDVVFQLADLPFEVRLAGLDRDIGWMPAAGRSIRFSFE
jgi:hypothetical protein